MKNLFAVCLSISIILGGCQPINTNNTFEVTNVPSPTPMSILVSAEKWLRKTPCAPPCWEGITPGETSGAEARNILSQLPYVTAIEVYEGADSGYYQDKGEISWEGISGSGGRIKYYLPSTVYLITVDYNHRINLQDVTNAYGNPSHIRAAALPGIDDEAVTLYFLDVVYLSQGFALNWKGDGGTQKLTLKPNWSNFYLSFFEPIEAGFALAWGNPSIIESLTQWRGLLSFDDYCKGERCK